MAGFRPSRLAELGRPLPPLFGQAARLPVRQTSHRRNHHDRMTPAHPS